MIGQIKKIENLNENIKSFWFEPEHTFNYLAGQYIDVQLEGHQTINWYTLSSSPTEKLMCFTTRFSTPMSSYKKALIKLKVGDKIHFSDAIGDYVLPKDPTRPLLFVAGGIGITPVRSVIKNLTDLSDKRRIKLIYVARNKNELIYDELFKSYPMSYIPILSRPDDDWQGESGSLSFTRLMKLIGDLDENTVAFISGPQTMVENITNELGKIISPSQIIMDYFPGYATI